MLCGMSPALLTLPFMKNVFILISFLFPALCLSRSIVYVRPDSLPNADGKSWQTAFRDVNQALEVARYGDQVWVAGGTYRLRNTTDRRSSFILKNGVQVYGGFAGAETRLEQRDWTKYVTTLSGEIGQSGRTDNVYHVVYGKGLDSNTVLDGFSVTGGYYVSPFELPKFNNCGGGIILLGRPGMESKPVIRHCRIFQNASNYGGGIYISNQDLRFPDSTAGRINPRIEACSIERNYASMDGGGVFYTNSCDPSDTFYVSQSVFRFNHARFGNGGGICLNKTEHLRLWVDGCRFERDSAIDGASIVYLDGISTGPALNFHLRNSTFTRNYAIEGGAFLYRGDETTVTQEMSNVYMSVENCLIESNFPNESPGINFYKSNRGSLVLLADHLTARNNGGGAVISIVDYAGNRVSSRLNHCIFEGNAGGAFICGSNAGAVVENRINNCLFIKNFIGVSVGVSLPNTDSIQAMTTLTNCVFYHNTYEFGKSFSASYLSDTTKYNKMRFENCIIEHANDFVHELFGREPNDMHTHLYFFRNTSFNLPVRPSLPGNIAGTFPASVIFGTDPGFVNAEAGDFRLSPCSALIGKGENRYVQEARIEVDLDQRPRILFKNVDLGAYEQIDSCGVSSVQHTNVSRRFSIWPNPSSDGVLYWQTKENYINPESVRVFDATGHVVFEQALSPGNHSSGIATRLGSGCYFVQFLYKQGMHTEKWSVQRHER